MKVKFRRKATDFEAEQFKGFYHTPWPEGVEVSDDEDTRDACYVLSAHKQRIYLERGDWVVKEPNGDGYYAIKDATIWAIADEVK